MSPSSRSDDLYRAVFDVNTAIKLLIDPESGLIIDANSAAAAFYGWSLETLRTMRITDINTLTGDEVRAEMQAARTMRRSYFRFRHRTASGDVRAVEVHSGPLTIDGAPRLLSIIHDVTERDQLEEHARRGQRLEAIGQLAGGVAHDFNNLLTVMISAARLLRGRLPGDHPGVRFIDDIDEAAQRGADLTRQLLAFSRRQVLAPRPVALGEIAERLVPLLERSLGSAHAIALEVAPVPRVLADPAQIEQVVMNLVLNARDAMPNGGTIEVAIATSAGDASGAVPPGAWVTLAVADRGVGMDETTRSRVFEPFFTTKAEGTGMGLASVYGIVSQSGGHVTVESTPGRGTRFVAYLPATSEAQIAPPPPPPAIAGHLDRAVTILLVEDSEPLRASVAELLSDLGHQVVVAGSYDQAVAIVADLGLDTIDAVISDVVMPGRSGIELVRMLLERRAGLPCVIMSGDLREHLLGDLPASVARLPKPFSIDQLHEALRAAQAARTF